jgi:type IV pilus assembly protein PilV
MLTPHPARTRRARQQGTSMIEVLVSIVIVVLGLLGLAGLQSHATLAEMESFQRAQAIVLLQDMVDRINSNRANAMQYVTADPVGTGDTVKSCAQAPDPQSRDLCEWKNALLGAAESAGGLQVGAMIGARGCVENIKPDMPREFLVSVVWQGLSPTKEPATSCGKELYGDDRTRRALTTTITIGCLHNQPATGLCLFPQ